MELSQLSIADLRAVITTLKEKEELFTQSPLSRDKSTRMEISIKRQVIEDHLDERIGGLLERGLLI